MKRQLFLSCAAILAAMATLTAAEDRALLIGIGKYKLPKHDLPGIEKDIRAMTEIVRDIGFETSQIKILVDSDATLDGIRNAIRSWLIQGVTESDRVLLYYSGHGAQIPDVDGDETDGSEI